MTSVSAGSIGEESERMMWIEIKKLVPDRWEWKKIVTKQGEKDYDDDDHPPPPLPLAVINSLAAFKYQSLNENACTKLFQPNNKSFT